MLRLRNGADVIVGWALGAALSVIAGAGCSVLFSREASEAADGAPGGGADAEAPGGDDFCPDAVFATQFDSSQSIAGWRNHVFTWDAETGHDREGSMQIEFTQEENDAKLVLATPDAMELGSTYLFEAWIKCESDVLLKLRVREVSESDEGLDQVDIPASLCDGQTWSRACVQRQMEIEDAVEVVLQVGWNSDFGSPVGDRVWVDDLCYRVGPCP